MNNKNNTPTEQIIDRKTDQPGTRMTQPPLPGTIGTFILNHYSLETWNQWLDSGIMVINELRLDFLIPEHQHIYDQKMMQWLGFTQNDIDQQ